MEQMRQNELRRSNMLLSNMKKFALFMMLIITVVIVASSVQANEAVPGDVLVVFKPEFGTTVTRESLAEGGRDYERVKRIAEELDAEIVEVYSAISKIKNIVFVMVHTDSKSENILVNELLALPEVISASPNYKSEFMSASSSIPNDAMYPEQWGLGAIRAPEAWKITSGDYNTYVAVIDSGIYSSHEDIVLNFDHPHSKNFYGGISSLQINVDPNSYFDENGHGTHVAGIIGAYGGNNKGITGVNWLANIISLRIAGGNGKALPEFSILGIWTISDNLITQAVNYAIELLELYPEKRMVINISFGGYLDKSPEEMIKNNSPYYIAFSALDDTHRAVVCAAAGNDAIDVEMPAPDPSTMQAGDKSFKKGQYHYPSSFRQGLNNMIVVANATNNIDLENPHIRYLRNSGSNYSKKYVDVAAPGTDILSTLSRNHNETYDKKIIFNGNGGIYSNGTHEFPYVNMSGTSMAAPFVSGAAALLFSKYPNASAEDIANAIRFGANSYYSKDYTKYGFLNIDGAFRYMAGQSVPVGVPIDEFIFPDETFRSYIATEFDKDKNGYLSVEEISSVKIINVSGQHIADLTGIENFRELVLLDCSNTDIESFTLASDKVNQNDKLVDIDFSNCKRLSSVWFDGRKKLASLNLEGCSALTVVTCSKNDNLQNLNVNGCVALTSLTCTECSLVSLNLTGLSSLVVLDCSRNKIRTLDLSICSLLEGLYCDHNNIAALDLRSCPLLTSESINLAEQNCLGLKTYRISDRKYEVHFSDFMPLSSGDVFYGVILDTVQAYMDNGDLGEKLITYQKTYDAKTGILTFESVLSSDFAVARTPVRIKYKYITYPAKTVGLIGYDNSFYMDATIRIGEYETAKIWDDDKSDDIYIPLSKALFPDNTFRSYCSSVVDTDGDGVLNASEISKVTSLSPYNRSITTLKGVENFPNLEKLECYSNKLTDLDVSKNTKLKYLHCGSNKLATLDLSKCQIIETLYCDASVTITCSDGYLPIDSVHFPDAYFRSYLVSSVNSGNYIFANSAEAKVTSLSPYNRSITTLKGVENFPNLEKLECYGNNLTDLDLSKNTKLKYLHCGSNKLVWINIDTCGDLEFLNCQNNSIPKLNTGGSPKLVSFYHDSFTKIVNYHVDKPDLSRIQPEITTTNLNSAVTKNPYTFQLEATGTAPIKWTLKSGKLPTGLTLSESGLISGTPTKAGKFAFTVSVANSAGTDTVKLTLQVFDPVSITTTSLKVCTIGKSYSVTMKAKGTKTITWSAEGLPDGLTISEKGKISGKPTAYGVFNVKVKAENGAGITEKTLQLIVKAIAPKLSGSLAKATLNQPYLSALKVTGSTPITWSIEGNLPEGLTLDSSTGIISGTPTSYAKSGYKITLTATNDGGSKSKKITLKVNGKAPKITAKLPQATAGENYSAELSATGSEPITFTADLPEYLTLDGKTITGNIPESAKNFKVKVYASNPVKIVCKTYTVKVITKKKSVSEIYKAEKGTDITKNDVITVMPTKPEKDTEINSGYIIVAVLGEVSRDVSGMYDFSVELPDYIVEGSELVYLANSDKPSEDDDIAEFYDDTGAEISAVPENRRITVSIWLNPETVYYPVIAVKD